MPHYLVFLKGREDHSVGYSVREETPDAAIRRFLAEQDEQLAFHPDGSLSFPYEGSAIRYPHPLACIEALYKTSGEWQLRELPKAALTSEYQELFVGEHPHDVERLVKECRPAFREQFPHARASAFVWYLQTGALVTFYRRNRRKRPFAIQVLQRYLINWPDFPQFASWDGDYAQLLEQLWLKPPGAGE
jgi:hypothetical protein